MVSEPSCGAQERRTRTCPSRSTRSITKRGESPTGRGFGGDPSRPGRPGRHGEPGPTKVDQLAPGGCDRPLAAGDRGGGGRGQRSSLRTESEDRSRDRSDTDDGGAAGLRLSAPGCWMTPASSGPAGVHPDGHPLRRGTRTLGVLDPAGGSSLGHLIRTNEARPLGRLLRGAFALPGHCCAGCLLGHQCDRRRPGAGAATRARRAPGAGSTAPRSASTDRAPYPCLVIELKSPREIEAMRPAGRFVAEVLTALKEKAAVGVNLLELDELAHDMIRRAGATSCYIDYHPSFGASPFGKVLCTSVNAAVLHGLPHDDELADGDLLSVDFAASGDGWVADSALSVVVGTPRQEDL